ncbi:uncharacterized protein LOC111619822 [Centruroides sculpturatus]|uniref:uncharacterized protein LOC111619822 n=1 Tax=Centruroides sculpturatus TaxID=218467 RepID=UPI000C6DABCF|nr:uncharacterized protein LOC111619822 [Centruroides sculpturatus]
MENMNIEIVNNKTMQDPIFTFIMKQLEIEDDTFVNALLQVERAFFKLTATPSHVKRSKPPSVFIKYPPLSPTIAYSIPINTLVLSVGMLLTDINYSESPNCLSISKRTIHLNNLQIQEEDPILTLYFVSGKYDPILIKESGEERSSYTKILQDNSFDKKNTANKSPNTDFPSNVWTVYYESEKDKFFFEFHKDLMNNLPNCGKPKRIKHRMDHLYATIRSIVKKKTVTGHSSIISNDPSCTSSIRVSSRESYDIKQENKICPDYSRFSSSIFSNDDDPPKNKIRNSRWWQFWKKIC